MFKVTGHVFKEVADKVIKVGVISFNTFDHDLASTFADGIGDRLPINCTVNTDVEMQVHLGRRPTWVDCNPRSLERAAEELMQAAQDIRKPRVVSERELAAE